MNRRQFLTKSAAGLLIPAAPAIVSAANIMPVRAVNKLRFEVIYGADFVSIQTLDGWLVEKITARDYMTALQRLMARNPFYGPSIAQMFHGEQ